MDFVLASRNKKKIAEIETILKASGLSEIRLLSLDDIGFKGEIEETGTTFEENAKIKAAAAAALGFIGIADDSGLEVDALGGRPGVYSARYAGEHANDEKNNLKLLKELQDLPADKRTARFVSVFALVCPSGESTLHDFTVRGECEGVILTAPRGSGGFGYDPLFFLKSHDKTFAELTLEQKNTVSHRGAALRQFVYELKKLGVR